MARRFDNPLTATLTGIADQFRKTSDIRELDEGERFEQMTALVTGANSGLGYAIATDLCRRGTHVIMACRSGVPEAGDAIRAETGGSVEMRSVDLSSFDSIRGLCDSLRDDGVTIDRLILNAGVMPRESRTTSEGFELMFGVNFLANVLIVDRLLDDGVVSGGAGGGAPRIVVVSSESHRGAGPIDWARFGVPSEYGLTGGMKHYGYSKLCSATWSTELARRLADDAGDPTVEVHCLCPGPINSNMAREAPWWVQPILRPTMRWFFNSPEVAAQPVVYLALAPELTGQTGLYLHMRRKRDPSEHALDPIAGERLWEASHRLIADGSPPT